MTIDAPGEIKKLIGEFIYNFYTPDETTNGDPQKLLPNIIRSRLPADNNSVVMSNILREMKYQRFIPRSVALSWNPVNIGTRPDLINPISIETNISSVQFEETMSGDLFSSVVFKDNGTDGKILYAIRRAMEEIVKSQGLPPLDSVNSSPLELTKVLNSITSTSIKGNFLADSFISLKDSGITFLDKPKLDKTIKTVSDRLKDVKLKVSINNKFIGTILKASSQENDNIFGDETMATLPIAETIQTNSIMMHAANIISGKEYETDISGYLDFEESKSDDLTGEYQSVGYIITRTEYPPAGGVGEISRIIIENSNISNLVDYRIKYGTKYGYTIRTVFFLKLPAVTDDNKKGYVTLLIASQACIETVVECREFRPPEPPTDFNITWDFNIGRTRLTWNFPVDSQRDTKYFQVFKRASINEPFQLIKMYDFNDSTTPISLNDLLEYNIDPVLVENLRNKDGTALPKTLYLDMSFEKEHNSIYCVAAIDAHGQTSNYSTQLRVTFNKYKNKIVKELVSVTGAPKAYPNFFYNKDTFVDSIRTSGVSNLDIYFNPEYLKVLDRAKNDLQLLKTSVKDNNKTPPYHYQLQLINIDLQKDVKINIALTEPPRETAVPPAPTQPSRGGIKIR